MIGLFIVAAAWTFIGVCTDTANSAYPPWLRLICVLSGLFILGVLVVGAICL